MKPSMSLEEVRYVHNQVLRSLDGERFYFVARAKILEGGALMVIGKKVDVTESVQALLPKKKAVKR